MKQFILDYEINPSGKLIIAKLPRGYENAKFYLTNNKVIPQRAVYENRLEIGHDFQIRSNTFYSRRVNCFKNVFLLMISEDNTSNSKNCKICKSKSSGSFCGKCGAYIF